MHIYTTNAELIAAGCSQYWIATRWALYAKTFPVPGEYEYDTSQISIEAIDSAVGRYGTVWPGADAPTVPALLEIEAFDRSDIDYAISQYRRALQRWKSAEPEKEIGLYRVLPRREYLIPLRLRRSLIDWDRAKWERYKRLSDEWEQHNKLMSRELVPHVDYLCPSIYSYPNCTEAEWRAYSSANIEQAIAMSRGKPVRPIIQSYRKGGGDTIGKVEFGRMLDWVAAWGLDVMIHSGTNEGDWMDAVRDMLETTKPD